MSAKRLPRPDLEARIEALELRAADRRALPNRELRGIRFRTVRGYLIACTVLLLGMYGLAWQMNQEARAGCERLDSTREVVYSVLADAIPNLRAQRRAAATREERTALAVRIAQYRGYIQALRQQSRVYRPSDPDYPAEVSCAEAYPRPFPANVLGFS